MGFYIKADGSVWGAGMHRFDEFGYESADFEKILAGPVYKVDAENRNAMLLMPAKLPPQKLELAGGGIFENAKAGVSAGNLVASDFDSDSNFTYSLVSGTGSTHNHLF